MRRQAADNCLPPNQNDIRSIEMASRDSLLQRFEEKYIVEPNSGCWLWTAATLFHGYGAIRIDGQTKRAHRVSYELFNGPIPEGMHILHKCDTPCCVRPDHLKVGDHKENMHDMIAKGRDKHEGLLGARNGSAKLTESSAMYAYQSKKSVNELADELGVSDVAIRKVKRRHTWRHIHSAPQKEVR